MSNNVQSIVCCLGDPVAGNPTQFLMQRAAASLGIDWMFVTAEVPPRKIEEAFQGIRALRFSGVAFLPPHRLIGCKLVDSMTEAATRSGHVRVARRDGDLWLGDDSLGAAIAELLKPQQYDLASAGENSKRASIVVSGKSYLPHLVRLALGPDRVERLVELVDTKPTDNRDTSDRTHGNNAGAASTSGRAPSSSTSSASTPTLSFDESLQSELLTESLIVDSMAPCMTPRQLLKLRWTKNPVAIFVDPNPKWEAALATAKIENLRILRPLDLAAAKAVVNFQFWTGHAIDLASIRESLDEYCQW
jgi:shikimate dehydrogenase